jgi:hypothetical protein
MLPYFLLFAIPGLAALNSLPSNAHRRGTTIPWFGFAAVLTLMVGLRYHVGGDWYSYLAMLHRTEGRSLAEVVDYGDPGYMFVNWLFADTGLNVWIVNLVCGSIFAIGLYRFCRNQPHPWLTLLVAIPYLVVVVAMGYSRQAVAIGMAMLALVALEERSIPRFILWIALAATFHRTAVLLIPVGILGYRRHNFWTITLVGAAGIALFVYLLQGSEQGLVRNYIYARYDSSGAQIRIFMNALPAVIYLSFRRQFQLNPNESRLWTIMSLIALAFVAMLYISPSSAAVDRMGLYFIPIQLFVLGRLPLAWSRNRNGYQMIAAGVVLYSATVLLIWLFFADNAPAWVPYQLFPVEALAGPSY